MAFPEIIDPTDPGDGVPALVGPKELRALKLFIADLLGLPVSPTQITAAPFSITAGGVVAISQAGVTVAADPTTALGIATKQYVDSQGPPAAVYQYTPLPTQVSVPINTQTQILQTPLISALPTSPHGHWIVNVVARCVFLGVAGIGTVAAFLQINSDFISAIQTSGNTNEAVDISFVLPGTFLVADGQTVQATLSLKSSNSTGTVPTLDPVFILIPTDITIVATPQ